MKLLIAGAVMLVFFALSHIFWRSEVSESEVSESEAAENESAKGEKSYRKRCNIFPFMK